MLQIKAVHLAEYAVAAEGRLSIAGIFDKLEYSPNAQAPSNARVPIQRLYLAIVAEASLADGLRHPLRLRILNGSGVPIGESMPFQIDFALNKLGRLLRANIVILLNGLALPGPDDYVFEVSKDEQALTVLGDTILTVLVGAPTADG